MTCVWETPGPFLLHDMQRDLILMRSEPLLIGILKTKEKKNGINFSWNFSGVFGSSSYNVK